MRRQAFSRPQLLIAILFSTLIALVGCSRSIPLAAATSTKKAQTPVGQSAASAIDIQLEAPAFSSEPLFQVSATAHGHASIVEMKLYLDGVLSARSGWGELSTEVQAEPGDHNLMLRAADSGGHSAEKSVRVTVADAEPRGHVSRISFTVIR